MVETIMVRKDHYGFYYYCPKKSSSEKSQNCHPFISLIRHSGQNHAGHQEIRKCRERARDSVWWPGLSKQMEDMVTTCTTCCKQKRNHAEPMMPPTLPERPWQKISVDLFHHSGKEYIIAVDY